MYRYSNKTSGAVFEGDLELGYEVHCDPISDNFTPADLSAVELWEEWRKQYPRNESAEEVFGPDAFRISWFVDGPATFEAAPFQDVRNAGWLDEHFLTFFTWPINVKTGGRLQWSALPVRRKQWNSKRADKGGFITEATGWTPAPLQPYVNVRLLALASGLAVAP